MATPRHTKAELLSLLQAAEQALSKTREHNPWDLGPSPVLVRIREVLGLPAGKK